MKNPTQKVFDYYRDDKEILDTNIFRIFEQDIEDILKDTEKRYVDYKQKYHDDNFNHLTLTKDDILSQYKKAIKYIKKNPKKFL